MTKKIYNIQEEECYYERSVVMERTDAAELYIFRSTEKNRQQHIIYLFIININ